MRAESCTPIFGWRKASIIQCSDIEKARGAKAKQNTAKERTDPTAEKEAHTVDDKTLDEMFGNPVQHNTEHKQSADVTEKVINPTKVRTEKSNPSAPTSEMPRNTGEAKSERPSVRQHIQDIKAERQTEKQKQPAREKTRQTTHKQPSKKKTKSKGR